MPLGASDYSVAFSILNDTIIYPFVVSGIIMVSEYDIEDSLESTILLSLLFAVVNGIDTRTNSTSTQIRAFLMQIYDEYTILFLIMF